MGATLAVTMLQAESAAPDFSFLIMLGSIGLIFYFLVFRPQNKKQKDLDQAIKGAEKGDEVVTTGGLHGKVHAAAESVVTVEIASVKGTPVRVDIDRSRIERVIKAEELREQARENSKQGKKGGKDKGGDES